MEGKPGKANVRVSRITKRRNLFKPKLNSSVTSSDRLPPIYLLTTPKAGQVSVSERFFTLMVGAIAWLLRDVGSNHQMLRTKERKTASASLKIKTLTFNRQNLAPRPRAMN
jgi:hypothetical protein